jgi:hypothetical protein
MAKTILVADDFQQFEKDGHGVELNRQFDRFSLAFLASPSICAAASIATGWSEPVPGRV